jgi:predicted nucleic acid-binding protein
MKLVVDANIIFAVLLKDGFTSDIIFRDSLQLYAPDYILAEFEDYRELIENKTERTDEEFNQLLEVLKRRITLVKAEEIKPFIERAIKISPDIKDTPYVALALMLNVAIWSNDKDLKEKQKVVQVHSTQEIAKM